MATYTSFLNLEKPTTSERLDVLKINSNWDKIDEGVSALNSQMAKMVSLGTSATGSPVSVTVGGGTRAIIIGVSPANNSKFLAGIYATNAGAVTVDDFVTGSNMTATTGTNNVTISNSSSNGSILFALVFAGSISV